MWQVQLTEPFEEWLLQQDSGLRKRVAAALLNLQHYGPLLPRPYADTVSGSRFHNMKELRVQYAGHPIRAFYAFDIQRKAIVLCAGDKTGDKHFYQRMIESADEIFSCHLADLEGKAND
ncbi:hypothetical protein VH86_15570 [Pantoea sp. BL1]|uniref:Addiction module toxin RelE n=1 Tax=Pantoea rwandensis TaxID=1076550 RepID=A0ABM5REA9_9GAMM|nr:MULTISPECIES: type II toxin-antitoxin system RelE/ParE family toxin [Pantoea]AIR84335.1 hypothetical protein LH22_02230 [Pantoea rwandensis]KJV47479.1 hypothetical protein VH86_15570 [Pantoea sp. BL1]MBK0126566.1 type II toxin-antitoxin system RelE/ParE family toxin [Pantoea sp. S61]